MKLTKEKIKEIFNNKELVFLINKYISEGDEPLPRYITDDNIINESIDNYFYSEEQNILYRIDGYDPYDGDIHASYYNFYDFLIELKEHYKNNTDMEG